MKEALAMKTTITPSFFLISQERSGTNFIKQLITSSGVVGENIPNIDRIEKEGLDLEGYYNHSNLPRDFWGMYSHNQDTKLLIDFCQENDIVLNQVKWIWLVRKDKIAQAISLHRARGLDVWFIKDETEKSDQPVSITDTNLLEITGKLFFADQYWETFLQEHELDFHKIYYEDFCDREKWEVEISAIFDFLEVPYDLPLTLTTDFMRQFSSEKSKLIYDVWVKKFSHKIPSIYTPFEEIGEKGK